MRVYLDNAATTPIDKEVLKEMYSLMENQFGNPSSIHAHGRESRAAIEKSRRIIANLLQTSPSEILYCLPPVLTIAYFIDVNYTKLSAYFQHFPLFHGSTNGRKHPEEDEIGKKRTPAK